MKKNDELVVEIVDVTNEGLGVSKSSEQVLFVIGGVTLDTLKVRIIKVYKNYAIAKIVEIIIPSKYRTEPKCEVFNKCGGCTLQHIDYNYQLELKEKIVKDNLQKIGGISKENLDIVWNDIKKSESPYRYRNKTIYPCGKNEANEIIIGFYKKKTHEIIESNDCVIGQKIDEDYKKIIRNWMIKYGITPYNELDNSGAIRHIIIRHTNNTQESMLIIVANKKVKELDKLKEFLLENERIKKNLCAIYFSINNKKTNVILTNKCELVWSKDTEHKKGIIDKLGNKKYIISPNSFYQVNKYQMEVLYNVVREIINSIDCRKKRVWDLFCGAGTIGLYISDIVKEVKGIEVVKEAANNAKENAKINNIENVSFECTDILKDVYSIDIRKEDVVIFDPPRKGLSKSLKDMIINKNPAYIIYVSCDSATLARDIKDLSNGGYEIKKIICVDMFSMTGHVETVVLLRGEK